MTTPSTGPISLGDIAAEFGGSTPHALSEYYGVALNIPTSGQISIGQFLGKSANFSVSATPNSVYRFSQSNQIPISASVTAYVNGGIGPFTYAWTKASGFSVHTHIYSSNTATTHWYGDGGTNNGYDETSTWICTVTDSNANVAVSNTVVVELEHQTIGFIN